MAKPNLNIPIEIVLIISIIAGLIVQVSYKNSLIAILTISASLIILMLVNLVLSNRKETTNEQVSMSPISNFFVKLGGADPTILNEECPLEASKYEIIGGVILITGILAVLSGGYALYKIFHNPFLAGIFGLIWGTLIVTLDMMMVTSIQKNRHILLQIMQTLPRIALALIISLVISKPLEVKIFEERLAAQISKKRLDEQEKEIQRINKFTGLDINQAQMDENKEKIQAYDNKLENLSNTEDYKKFASELVYASNSHKNIINNNSSKIKEYQQKIANKEGSHEIRAKLNSLLYKNQEALKKKEVAQKNLENFVSNYKKTIEIERTKTENKVKELEGKEDSLEHSAKDYIVSVKKSIDISFDSDSTTNFVTQLEALAEMTENDNKLKNISWMLMLIFFVVELAPILTKLFSSKGIYDTIIEDKKRKKIKEIQEKEELRNIEYKAEHDRIQLKEDRLSMEPKAEQDRIQQEINAKQEIVRLKNELQNMEIKAEQDMIQQEINAKKEMIRMGLEMWTNEKIKELNKQEGDENYSSFLSKIRKFRIKDLITKMLND